MKSRPKLFFPALLRALFASLAPATPGLAATAAAPPQSQWVQADASGRLVYQALPRGDKIMDFSFAGYGGGGVALPTPPVRATVSPSGNDDSGAIQAAIDTVSRLNPVDGFRGAVLLAAGVFHCARPLSIRTGGVVLRGSGSEPAGTVIELTGKPHVGLLIAGSATVRIIGPGVRIADAYVPAGATSFDVTDPAAFKVGDSVLITRPVTSAWIKFMGMDRLVRNGRRQTWLSGEIHTERVITAISGRTITVDIPLSDSFDAHYLDPPGGSLAKDAVRGQIFRVGIENLRIVSPPQAITINQPQYAALRLKDVTDAWVRNLAIIDTIDSVQLGAGAKRITVDHVAITHTVATRGAALPSDFLADGTQLFFNRCSSTGDRLFYFATGGRVTGPNVLLNCVFQGNGHLQPHTRWATGLLVDECRVPDGGIDFMNRGIMGSGHGWTVGWAVAWNCAARTYLIQEPPGAANWAIGCRGEPVTANTPFNLGPKLPKGIFDSPGIPVTPASLYLAQLRARLGPQALKNIGY